MVPLEFSFGWQEMVVHMGIRKCCPSFKVTQGKEVNLWKKELIVKVYTTYIAQMLTRYIICFRLKLFCDWMSCQPQNMQIFCHIWECCLLHLFSQKKFAYWKEMTLNQKKQLRVTLNHLKRYWNSVSQSIQFPKDIQFICLEISSRILIFKQKSANCFVDM